MSCIDNVAKAANTIEKYSSGVLHKEIPKPDLEVILAARHHQQQAVRNHARNLLRQVMKVNPTEIIGLLRHKDPNIRMEAVNTIGDQGDARHIRAVAHVLLNDVDPEVRIRAAYAISRLKKPLEAEQYLEQARNDNDPSVRQAVNVALNNLFRIDAPGTPSMLYHGEIEEADIRILSDEALDARIRMMEDAYRQAFKSPRAEQEMEQDATLQKLRQMAEARYAARPRPEWSGNPFRRSYQTYQDAVFYFPLEGEGLYDE